jgi:hypothetical protein
MEQQNSPLTFILSPRRGEADESYGRINVMAIERAGVASPQRRGEGEGEELIGF